LIHQNVLGIEIAMLKTSVVKLSESSGETHRDMTGGLRPVWQAREKLAKTDAALRGAEQQECAAMVVFAGRHPVGTAHTGLAKRRERAGLAQGVRHEAEARPRVGQPLAPERAMLAFQVTVQRVCAITDGQLDDVPVWMSRDDHPLQCLQACEIEQVLALEKIAVARIDLHERHNSVSSIEWVMQSAAQRRRPPLSDRVPRGPP